MADDNALQNYGRVPTLQSGGQVLVNPLGAITAGNQAASGVYDLRAKQGQQLWGEALQQSTDENGNVDIPKAQRIAAGMGPAAAMAARAALLDTSSLRGQQIEQSKNQLGFNDAQQTQIGKSFGAMINQPDKAQTPAAYKAQLQQLHANGTIDDRHLAGGMAAIDSLGPNPDPRTMRLTGTRMLMTALSTADIATQALPHTQIVTGPQGAFPYVTQPAPAGAPPTGGMYQAPGGFAAGQAPQPGQVPDTRQGAPPGTYTPVIPPGGGGTQPLPSGTAAPAKAAPPVPSPIPGGGVYKPPSAAPPLAAPGTPPATPNAAATPTPDTNQPTYTAPPAGQADVLQKDINARTAALTAMGDQQKRLIAGQSALDALRLADTGPSTGFFARAYAFLKAQGITTVPQGQLSDTDYRQLLQKNLLRFAQSSGQASGTDLGLETKLHANANVDEMLAAANRHVLMQDLGIHKRDIAQTQEMPAASGVGDVVKHLGSFSANIAPEAFMWNAYTPAERDAIEAQYAKDGQTKKLHDSLELAVKRGDIPDPRKAPPPPAAAAPSPPPAVTAPPPSPPAARPKAPGAQSFVSPNPLSAYA